MKDYLAISYEVLSHKFNVVRICVSGNHAQKWITESFNY